VFFLVIFAALAMANLVWWLWADSRARRLPHPRAWRAVIATFTVAQLAYLAYFLVAPVSARHAHRWMPTGLLATVYLWHLLVLPATFLTILLAGVVQLAIRGVRAMRRRVRFSGPVIPPSDEQITGPLKRTLPENDPRESKMSRRTVLAGAAMAIPPLALGGLTTVAIAQLGSLRIRRFDVPIADLPRDLDGLTIAHVSDIHIGRFTRPYMLPKIIDAANNLRADLTLMTGDLIDLSLSDLPAGIDFMRKLDARHGVYLIEGNHDLIENPWEFERQAVAAGLPILLNEATTLTVRGVPIQLLGIRWGRRTVDQRVRRPADVVIRESVSQVLARRRPDALPILLAHHPHAFDPAAEVGIPLTLAGHTHGGQLMLNERLGAGPVMFRYWSGLYRKASSSLIVSNGTGNWFPLRINAPAEIVHVTLRRNPE
jgi:predicted MPP superfamily phosphohydrolase